MLLLKTQPLERFFVVINVSLPDEVQCPKRFQTRYCADRNKLALQIQVHHKRTCCADHAQKLLCPDYFKFTVLQVHTKLKDSSRLSVCECHYTAIWAESLDDDVFCFWRNSQAGLGRIDRDRAKS